MSDEHQPDDICTRPDAEISRRTQPLAPPLVTTSVWRCASLDDAEQLLAGTLEGYVYQRDGHPNADMLREKYAQLHRAERAAITSSGMAALALAALSQLRPGDGVVVSHQLYGRTRTLFADELARWGIEPAVVDTNSLAAVRRAMTPRTRLIVVETISNPVLRVADLAGLAEIAQRGGALLLVDNTFATPVLCRPIDWGATLVMESGTKMLNGHSDVILGLLCGSAAVWEAVPRTSSVWGLASSPFDCWLTLRGLSTLHLRMERACANALRAAEHLRRQSPVERVDYPGLPDHPDHTPAAKLLGGSFGSIVTFHLRGGREAAERFVQNARRIPFCPSLGEISTTLSHPESTSHRGLSASQRHELGITGGTIRLSVGVETAEHVLEALNEGLAGLA